MSYREMIIDDFCSLALGEEDEKDKSVIASLNHIAAKFAQVQVSGQFPPHSKV
jgi:hypothetical protein